MLYSCRLPPPHSSNAITCHPCLAISMCVKLSMKRTTPSNWHIFSASHSQIGVQYPCATANNFLAATHLLDAACEIFRQICSQLFLPIPDLETAHLTMPVFPNPSVRPVMYDPTWCSSVPTNY